MSLPVSPGERPCYPRLFSYDSGRSGDQDPTWLSQLYLSIFDRTSEIELTADLQFHKIFQRLEEVRHARGQVWPQWCWMPTREIASVLVDEYAYGVDPGQEVGLLEAGLSPEHDVAKDAARLAAVAAWRQSGRHVAVLGEPNVPVGGDQDCDRLPYGLPSRWPAACLYVVDASVGQGASGAFVYLDWNQVEYRTELRVLLDAGEAAFTGLIGHTIHLCGHTVIDAVSSTWTAQVMDDRGRRGDDRVLDVSPGSAFDAAVTHTTPMARAWTALARRLIDEMFHDAAGALGLADAVSWPPPLRPGETGPMLWLADSTVDSLGPTLDQRPKWLP
jgi:hypothetical protein